MDECPSCGEHKFGKYAFVDAYYCKMCEATIEPAVEFRVEAHE